MSCSKLFSGDLPELLNEIMKYLNDISTLHSCVLVNRIWCRLAIPLLWEDPFSFHDYSIIDYLLNNLSEEDKIKLKEYEINSKILPLNTLFNYPSFIKKLNTKDMIYCIKKWVATSSTLKNDKQNLILRSNFLNSIRLIYKSLFKILIENQVKLHTFKIKIITGGFFNSIIELILQNPNFIYNIKNFMICISYRSINNLKNIETFLSLLSLNNNSFSTLYFQYGKLNNIIKHTSLMISLQKNLKKIIFRSNDYPLYDSLLSLKNSNCSNTLKTIIFYQIDFNNIFIFKEFFEQLNVLDSIHMIYCQFFNSEFIQQINNLNKPFKLRSLYIQDGTYHIDSMELLLKKSNDYLENFGFGLENRILIDLVKNHCKKIKFLEFPEFDNIYLAFDLIENIGQNLNYLNICFHDSYNDYYDDEELIEFSSTILKDLGQILPLRLEYLYLYLYTITTSDFEIFLKNSQNTFIEKFLIINHTQTKDDDNNLTNLLDEYIVKKRRVRYLALKDHDMFYLEEKCKLYGIIIKDYKQLFTSFYDYINEICHSNRYTMSVRRLSELSSPPTSQDASSKPSTISTPEIVAVEQPEHPGSCFHIIQDKVKF
ncbi:hypothetical protein RhiirC2_787097 [Rhizophagus irregularis]|uniref:F-box domain-containing protein n=1 Tax=Rhizophagus irregularis TaxID=588596 RepID=A0A2N1MSW8_9GLOM|nr:hypothetical protein RhiirC2_787097 [Rhizophagus irregularis]